MFGDALKEVSECVSQHRLQPTNLQDQFTVLKKCRTKFWLSNPRYAVYREHKTKTLHAIGFSWRQTSFYITIEYFKTLSIPYIFSPYCCYIDNQFYHVLWTWWHGVIETFYFYIAYIYSKVLHETFYHQKFLSTFCKIVSFVILFVTFKSSSCNNRWCYVWPLAIPLCWKRKVCSRPVQMWRKTRLFGWFRRICL